MHSRHTPRCLSESIGIRRKQVHNQHKPRQHANRHRLFCTTCQFQRDYRMCNTKSCPMCMQPFRIMCIMSKFGQFRFDSACTQAYEKGNESIASVINHCGIECAPSKCIAVICIEQSHFDHGNHTRLFHTRMSLNKQNQRQKSNKNKKKNEE